MIDIRNMDVMEGYKIIGKDCIDFIVTSPPYNLGMDYGTGVAADTIPWDEYYTWCWGWLKESYRVLKPNRRLCLNHYLSCGEGGEDKGRGRQAPLMELNHIAQEVGFKHHGVAIWDEATVSKGTAWGSWLSASAPYINSPYEGILILYKGDWKREDKGRSTISKEDFIEACHGVWKMQPEKNRHHPAPFPIKLPRLCIDLLTYEEDLVCDPFGGTFTTAVACKLTKRNFIGFDSNQDYCKMGRARVDSTLIMSNLGGI